MAPRFSHTELNPERYRRMAALSSAVQHCGLDHRPVELLKMRASQINGCAYCLDMHSKEARAIGETEQRLYALSAWREAPFYRLGCRRHQHLEPAGGLSPLCAGQLPTAPAPRGVGIVTA